MASGIASPAPPAGGEAIASMNSHVFLEATCAVRGVTKSLCGILVTSLVRMVEGSILRFRHLLSPSCSEWECQRTPLRPRMPENASGTLLGCAAELLRRDRLVPTITPLLGVGTHAGHVGRRPFAR